MELRTETIAAINVRRDLACRVLDQLKDNIANGESYQIRDYVDAVDGLVDHPEPFDRFVWLPPALEWVKAELELTLVSAVDFFDLTEREIEDDSETRPETEEELAYVSDGTERFWVRRSALDEKIDPIVGVDEDENAYARWCRAAIVD